MKSLLASDCCVGFQLSLHAAKDCIRACETQLLLLPLTLTGSKVSGALMQGRAGQGRAGQGRAGQGRAGQGRAGQGRAGLTLDDNLEALCWPWG